MTDPQTALAWEDLPSPQPILYARSLGEAMLYLRVRGAELIAARSRSRDGRLEVAVRHHGEQQVLTFQLRDPLETDLLWLGGAAPSSLLDPVDLVLFASRVERELPLSPDLLSREILHARLQELQLAAEAVAEALKFIGPGQQRVPRERLSTAAARRLYDLDPDRFSRPRLLALAERLLRRST
jgi:hypothetical protein